MKTRLSSLTRGLLMAAAAVGAVGCTQPPIQVRPVSSTLTGANADYDLNYQSAVTAINDRDYARALDYLQAARDKDPKNVRVLNAFGVVYDKLGRFDLSARYYTQARAIEPDSRIVAANISYSRKLQGLVSPGSDTMLAAAEPQDAPASPPSPLRLTDLPSTSVMPVAGLLPVAPTELVAAAEPEETRAPVPAPLRLTELPPRSLTHAAPLAPLATTDVALADVDVPRPNVPPPLRLTDRPTVLHTTALAPFHPADVIAAAVLDDVRMPVPQPRRLTELPAGSLLHEAALAPFTPYDVLAAAEAEDASAPIPAPRRLTDQLPGSPLHTATLASIPADHVDDVAEPEAPRPNVPPPKSLTDHAQAGMVHVATLAQVAPGHVDDVADPEVPRPNVPPPKALTGNAPAGMIRTASLAPIAPGHVDDVAAPEVPRPVVPPPKALTDHAPAGLIRTAALTPIAPSHVDEVMDAPKPVTAPIAITARAEGAPVQKIAMVELPAQAAHGPASPTARLPAVPAIAVYSANPIHMVAAVIVNPRLPAVPQLSGTAPSHVAAATQVKTPGLQVAALRLPAVPRLAPAVPQTVALLTPVTHYRVEIVNASGRKDGAEPIRRGLAAMGWSVPVTRIADRTTEASTTLVYPASGKAMVTAWARTLPFRVRLAADTGNTEGMQLVVGSDFLTWQHNNRRVSDGWRKALTIVARADVPESEAQ